MATQLEREQRAAIVKLEGEVADLRTQLDAAQAELDKFRGLPPQLQYDSAVATLDSVGFMRARFVYPDQPERPVAIVDGPGWDVIERWIRGLAG